MSTPSTLARFIERVEAFLERHTMAASRFGLLACGVDGVVQHFERHPRT